LMGYGGMTPAAEAGKFGRQLETRKVEAPVDVASMQAQTARDVAGTERAGALERMLAQTGSAEKIAGEREKGLEQRMQDMYLSNVSGLGNQLSSMNPSTGAASFRQSRDIEPALLNKLQDARAKLAAAQPGGFGKFFGQSADPAALAAYQQAQASIIADPKWSPKVQMFAGAIAKDPTASSKTFEQLAQESPAGIGALPLPEQDQLRALLGMIRGGF
jgi:hypothetical protein